MFVCTEKWPQENGSPMVLLPLLGSHVFPHSLLSSSIFKKVCMLARYLCLCLSLTCQPVILVAELFCVIQSTRCSGREAWGRNQWGIYLVVAHMRILGCMGEMILLSLHWPSSLLISFLQRHGKGWAGSALSSWPTCPQSALPQTWVLLVLACPKGSKSGWETTALFPVPVWLMSECQC